ncbi:MAG: hypothetical protein V7641_5010 [Blastocatellia bacterium]
MKKQLTILASILVVLLAVCGLALAQSQSVNQLPVTTTPAATDKLYIVTSPASSPASRAVTVATLLGNNGIQAVNVKAFGAKGDGFVVTDGAMNSVTNTSTLTCSTSHPFTAAMVGMRIDVNQAGALASSYYNNLTGTIVSYISASQVTVSFTCLHTVSGAQVVVTSDDTTAISNAKTAAGAHGTVYFPRGIYGISAQLSPLSEQTWAGEGIGVSVLYQMGVVRPTSGSAYNGINIADGVQDVTLRDFSLRGTNLQGASIAGAVAFGIKVGTGAGGAISNVTIQNVEVGFIYGLGLCSDGDAGDQAGAAATVINTRILACNIHHCSDNGVNVNTGGGLEIGGSFLTDNGAAGIEFSGSLANFHDNFILRNRGGVSLGGLGNPSLGRDNLLTRNFIARNGSGGSGAGVQIGGNVVHALVSWNFIKENEYQGVGITDGNPDFASLSRDITVAQNQIISNGTSFPGRGIVVGMDDVVISENDIFDDGVPGYSQSFGLVIGNDNVKLLHNRARNNPGYDYVFGSCTNARLVRDDTISTIQQYEPNGWQGTLDTSSTTATWKSGNLFNSKWVGVPLKIGSVYYAISAVAAAPTGNFTASGLTITRTSGTSFDTAWAGKYIRLGASLYFPIASVADGDHLTISNGIGNTVPASGAWTLNGSVSLTLAASAGTQTGAAWVIPPHVTYSPENAVLQIVPFSATPVFDASQGNTMRIDLTANVTSSQIINGVDGQIITFIIVQDSGGSHTFSWPTNVLSPTTIGSTASKFNVQSFRRLIGFWFPIADGKTNLG